MQEIDNVGASATEKKNNIALRGLSKIYHWKPLGIPVGSLLMLCTVCLLLIITRISWNYCISNVSAEEMGLRAVYAMYNFSDLEQLDRQMATLQECTTEEVYNQLTIDNEERSLNSYLKFKGTATYVTVIESTESYVKYSISNENIDESRVFIFTFSVGLNGKINSVWEAECLALY